MPARLSEKAGLALAWLASTPAAAHRLHIRRGLADRRRLPAEPMSIQSVSTSLSDVHSFHIACGCHLSLALSATSARAPPPAR